MSEQHTQELLQIADDGSIGSIQTVTGMSIGHTFQVSAEDLRNGWPIRHANAARLVACWNACQGIDTADLLAGSVSIIQKLHDEAAKRVLSQRDELLDQLEKIATADHEAQFAALDMKGIARSAIAKAEGGA